MEVTVFAGQRTKEGRSLTVVPDRLKKESLNNLLREVQKSSFLFVFFFSLTHGSYCFLLDKEQKWVGH